MIINVSHCDIPLALCRVFSTLTPTLFVFLLLRNVHVPIVSYLNNKELRILIVGQQELA